jgi:uncharacterized damage-inducible protein DinB
MKLDDLFPYWGDVRETIKDAVRGLDPEILDASPGKEVESMGALLRKLIYTERFWIGQVIKGEGSVSESDYSRENLPTAEEIVEQLEESRRATEEYLASATASDLDRHFVTPMGETMSMLSILWILFMNELHCRGQVEMLLRWLGLEPVVI